MNKEIKIILSISLVVLIGGILLFIKGNPQPLPPASPVDGTSLIRENSHIYGNKDAKVAVVEFGDYECPACANAEPIVERLRQEYKDNPNVKFVFRHFPLPQHTKALVSAEAAEAAGQQGKFWEMHGKIYENQDAWIRSGDHKTLFRRFAEELGLDVSLFMQTWEQNTFSQIIETDKKDGETAGVNSTPTFFINGEKASGYQYGYLKSRIEERLR